MRFAALGSGSKGNGWVVEAGATRLLLDCGFAPRELTKRLARLQLTLHDIDAILITHEHGDHAGGLKRGVQGPPLYMSFGTASVLRLQNCARIIDSHTAFALGDIEILPYPVPHDTREPVQFVFSDGAKRLAILTDLGHVTQHVIAMLSGVAALALECNHDLDMLARGPYPPPLKVRIAGPYGHIDNSAAAALLRKVSSERLQHVICAHLSEHNNRPELARQALAEVLGCTTGWIGIADQDNGLDWRQVG